ncbi:sugar ABC transporter substrate-binding protein [Cryobacterium sp. TMT1-3]|uniref:Sugar ABC transporter substrate-binding protein n=1 Tax=Cryobacterium luteum TaxID=1424661 RepID=A0A1H8HUY3_9MICO|nr:MULTISPECIES: sugar ABC transporter substrate-binding protein [Cryobacterium]TFB94201.1 sugar ABC transporter substrate-binding protein [Cryobacterium luteum]TFC26841.1 sugar ABC transporter substrate-binding protein [Cryobacterium sp. TMT1-3]SEN59983.1 carbohydrate ABC transporter substrate-binding protein, CUT1 family [Cryobacterium luteum]
MAKRSTIIAAGAAAVLLVIVGAVAALNFSDSDAPGEATHVTVRLWDEPVAAAYEKSFAAFEDNNTDIEVDVEVVPWNDYFEKLRTDVAGDGAPDVFWVDGGSYPAYADAGALLNITTALSADAPAGWSAAVTDQYTRDGALWGVPQLADPGIAVFYNADLLGDAGLTPADVSALTWDPTGETDTLIAVLQKLTKDYNGNTADSAEFDGSNLSQYGYNAGYDLQAMVLNYLASNGAQLQDDSNEYSFASDAGVASFQYLVDLMNKWQVAPSAADTNTNGDFSREQFLQGKMALFQSGVYNLANVSAGANFDWGVVQLPSGPAGAISAVDGIAAAGNAASSHPDETQRVLEWLGSAVGAEFLGTSGAASPAVLAAQPAYAAYWAAEKVDISPFYDVLAAGTAPAPRGAGWPAAENAMRPLLNEVFLGRTPAGHGVRAAQDAANATLAE